MEAAGAPFEKTDLDDSPPVPVDNDFDYEEYKLERRKRFFYGTIAYGITTFVVFTGAIVFKTSSVLNRDKKSIKNRKIIQREIKRLTVAGTVITAGYGLIVYGLASQFEDLHDFRDFVKPWLFEKELSRMARYIADKSGPAVRVFSEKCSNGVSRVGNALHLPRMAPPKEDRNILASEDILNYEFASKKRYMEENEEERLSPKE